RPAGQCTPSLLTTKTSSAVCSALATSNPTGTPPRGKARTTTSSRFRNSPSLEASRRPASKRSANSMALLLGGLLRLPSVGPHEFCQFQNMTFHGFAELLVGCSSWKADRGVEREEQGVIPMGPGRGL